MLIAVKKLKNSLDRLSYKSIFADGWKMLVDRYPLLCQFMGGLASVFPGTSTVEADFSVIGWEKNDYRTSLTNFSLEGILHCKQYDDLKDQKIKQLTIKISNLREEFDLELSRLQSQLKTSKVSLKTQTSKFSAQQEEIDKITGLLIEKQSQLDSLSETLQAIKHSNISEITKKYLLQNADLC